MSWDFGEMTMTEVRYIGTIEEEMTEIARHILQTWPQENMRLQYLRLSQLVLEHFKAKENEQ
jgi:hypothetical protein